MEWDVPYQVSRSFNIEISRTGHLIGTSSISRPPQEVALDALPVLLAFARGVAPCSSGSGKSGSWMRRGSRRWSGCC